MQNDTLIPQRNETDKKTFNWTDIAKIIIYLKHKVSLNLNEYTNIFTSSNTQILITHIYTRTCDIYTAG